MQQVIEELRDVRRWARVMLVADRAATLVAWVVTAIFALVVFDFFVRLPGTIRLVMLLVGLGAVGWGLVWYLWRVVRFQPTLTQVALRAESSFPTLKGRLASSLEFATAGVDQSNQLAARTVRDTQQRMDGASVRRALAPTRTLRDVGVMASTLTLAILLAWINPAAANTGLSRIFLPLGDAQWPARTGVQSLMDAVLGDSDVYPRGDAMPLRALVVKGSEDQRVDAVYRLQTDGALGPWQQIVLTFQAEGVHERLVDTSAEAIEFYFRTADARTEREHISLVPPPAVISAALYVTPPAYASGRVEPFEGQLGPGTDDRSVSERPSLIGSDVQLTLTLNKPIPVPELEANRAAWIRDVLGWRGPDGPTFEPDSADPSRWALSWRLQRTRELNIHLVDEHDLANSEPIAYRIEAIEDFGPSVTITEPQSDEAVLAKALVPLVGEATDDVAISRLGLEAVTGVATADGEAPPVVWSDFRDTDAVTASIDATLDLGTLDLSEGDVVLVTSVAQDMYELNGATHEPVRSSVRRLRVISELELAQELRRRLGAVRENGIRIEGHQSELQDDLVREGVQPGFTRAQSQVGDRVAAQREEVKGIQDLMDRNQLDDEQLAELLRQADDLLEHAGRASTRAGEMIAEREASLPAPQPQRDDAADSGDEAGAADDQPPADPSAAGSQPEGSEGQQPPGQPGQPGEQGQPGQPQPGEAGQPQPGQPGQPQPGEPQPGDAQPPEAGDEEAADPLDLNEDLDIPEPADEDREIVERQQEVRDELSDLIELLDRNEDTWVVTSQIKTLLEEQTRLAQETRELGRQTLGERTEDMSVEERTELDRIREKQMELKERAEQIIDSARKRAEDLEEHDPQSAAGMRAAADQAEEGELDRDMEQAGEQIEQNRMQQASTSQQRAMETLERMLEKMQETERAQAEELLRQLESLIESIGRLITIQENELTALAQARDNNDFVGRDRSMIRLNQNTQAVAGEARAAGQESRRIARLLDRAADAQGAAVKALRAMPALAAEAEEAENRSLELLKEAKTVAEELQEQTQQEETRRQREELIKAYRDFAEREITLRQETQELETKKPFDRRQLVEARRMGSRQEAIRSGIADLRDASTELMEATVFSLVHRLIDEWARAVSDTLLDGDVDRRAIDRQQLIVSSIGRLIEALEESMQPPDEFAEDQQAAGEGQGGSGQQPLIPPVAELKLLQGMQEQLYEQTRDIDARADMEEPERRSRLRDMGEQQRELLDIGRALLEQMNQQQQPGGMPMPSPQEPE